MVLWDVFRDKLFVCWLYSQDRVDLNELKDLFDAFESDLPTRVVSTLEFRWLLVSVEVELLFVCQEGNMLEFVRDSPNDELVPIDSISSPSVITESSISCAKTSSSSSIGTAARGQVPITIGKSRLYMSLFPNATDTRIL